MFYDDQCLSNLGVVAAIRVASRSLPTYLVSRVYPWASNGREGYMCISISIITGEMSEIPA